MVEGRNRCGWLYRFEEWHSGSDQPSSLRCEERGLSACEVEQREDARVGWISHASVGREWLHGCGRCCPIRLLDVEDSVASSVVCCILLWCINFNNYSSCPCQSQRKTSQQTHGWYEMSVRGEWQGGRDIWREGCVNEHMNSLFIDYGQVFFFWFLKNERTNEIKPCGDRYRLRQLRVRGRPQCGWYRPCRSIDGFVNRHTCRLALAPRRAIPIGWYATQAPCNGYHWERSYSV